jgi:phosphatidylglycerol:prolipoprotein diacylglycerol transferase
MIPYIHVPDLHILGLTLHPFGLLVATGVIVGTALATRRARSRGFDLDKLNSFITWMLVVGFTGGHVLDEIFYHPAEIVKRPWSLLLLYEGLSSFGGLTGALVGIVLWKYWELKPVGHLGPFAISWFKRRAQPQPILAFADLILSVYPVAWIFGRSGCSVVHDHPGMRAGLDAALAVQYPTPSPSAGFELSKLTHETYGPISLIHGSYPRYDLGTLELLFTIVLAGLLAITWTRRLPTGTYVVVTSLAYAPVRFAMDFLRVRDVDGADPRYAGLTPAQWECLVLFVFGLAMLAYVRSLLKKGIDPARLVLATTADTPTVDVPSPTSSA